MKLIGAILGFVAFAGFASADPMNTLESAAKALENSQIITGTACDKETAIWVSVDDDSGYTTISLEEGVVAAGYPEADEDGVVSLLGFSSVWGGIEFQATDGDSDEAIVSVSFTDSDVPPCRWKITADAVMMEINPCCKCVMDDGSPSSVFCRAIWCDRMTVVCSRNGDIPNGWCDWK